MSVNPEAFPATTTALRGTRVLDLSRVLAGPLCTQMLADHGAEVIKVESPAGDETRSWGPPFVGEDESAYFTALNRSKKNICVDLKTPAGRAVVGRLLERTDVVVENFRAGTMSKWGFNYRTDLQPRFPRLVYCRISSFGDTGPMGGMPGYDAMIQAYAGLMSVNGEPEGEPLRLGVPAVDMHTAVQAFGGVLLALLERVGSGLGQLVECSLLDAATSLLHPHAAAWLANGEVLARTGSDHPIIVPYGTFSTEDGLFFIGAGNDRQFRELMQALGHPELGSDSRFIHNADRLEHKAELTSLITELLADQDLERLMVDLLGRGVPASPINDVGQALSAPQVRHRGLVVESGDYRGVGFPIHLGRTPAVFRHRPRARGADTSAILSDAGYSGAEIREFLNIRAVFGADHPEGCATPG
jgi:crotonobetainyl-CoA:carnitine CoA-transferase CaiB-like acyl-CoA transferase